MAAPRQRCGSYKELLNETDREGNFIFGAMSTVLGGLGAIFTPASMARALSGAAGISGGVRSDFNSSFFYEKTIALLVKTIDSERERVLTEITRRMQLPVKDWPFSMALADVQSDHDLCSLPAAFSSLSEAVLRPAVQSQEELRRQQALRNALSSYASICTAAVQSAQLKKGCDELMKQIPTIRDFEFKPTKSAPAPGSPTNPAAPGTSKIGGSGVPTAKSQKT